MRTLAISLITLIIFSTSALATGPAVATSAKASNLEEVISHINYPIISRENAMEGRVVVLVRINEEGLVSSSKVLTAPCDHLKKAVEDAIVDLQFAPARDSNGESIASTVKIPIDFKLTVD